jgi:hypothetical protein
MALEWIKKNKLGGAKAFRDIAKNNWEPFAISQMNYKHKKLLLKPEVERNNRHIAQVERRIRELTPDVVYAEEEGLIADVKHFFSPPKPKQQLDAEIRKMEARSIQLKARADKTLKKSDDILSVEVFGADGGYSFSREKANVQLLQIGPSIQSDQGLFPAYYMVIIAATGDDVHTIAVHAAYRPRLMDANGCELQFESMPTFYEFLADYWQIYQRAGYATSSATIFRFNIRLAFTPRQDKLALAIHQHRIKEVHAELRG